MIWHQLQATVMVIDRLHSLSKIYHGIIRNGITNSSMFSKCQCWQITSRAVGGWDNKSSFQHWRYYFKLAASDIVLRCYRGTQCDSTLVLGIFWNCRPNRTLVCLITTASRHKFSSAEWGIRTARPGAGTDAAAARMLSRAAWSHARASCRENPGAAVTPGKTIHLLTPTAPCNTTLQVKHKKSQLEAAGVYSIPCKISVDTACPLTFSVPFLQYCLLACQTENRIGMGWEHEQYHLAVTCKSKIQHYTLILAAVFHPLNGAAYIHLPRSSDFYYRFLLQRSLFGSKINRHVSQPI